MVPPAYGKQNSLTVAVDFSTERASQRERVRSGILDGFESPTFNSLVLRIHKERGERVQQHDQDDRLRLHPSADPTRGNFHSMTEPRS